ncbi:MAG: biotin/lipoyl-containing protein, partial [Pseudomonadota bacterium]
MAKFTFNMPDVGEGVAEAEIVEWHVKVGDAVEEDQHLVDVMTDKATIDIESPVTGKVLEVAGEVGDVISVGAMLLVIEVEGDAEEEPAAETPAPTPASEPTPEPTPAPAPEPTPAPESAPTPAPVAEPAAPAAKVLATPAVRQRAHP